MTTMRFLLALPLIVCTFASFAAQEALVVTEGALVYADRELSAPIGHLRVGQRIRVGNVPRRQGDIYPIAVSGMIAWVKAEDLSFPQYGQELRGGTGLPREVAVKEVEVPKHPWLERVESPRKIGTITVLANRQVAVSEDDALALDGVKFSLVFHKTNRYELRAAMETSRGAGDLNGYAIVWGQFEPFVKIFEVGPIRFGAFGVAGISTYAKNNDGFKIFRDYATVFGVGGELLWSWSEGWGLVAQSGFRNVLVRGAVDEDFNGLYLALGLKMTF